MQVSAGDRGQQPLDKQGVTSRRLVYTRPPARPLPSRMMTLWPEARSCRAAAKPGTR